MFGKRLSRALAVTAVASLVMTAAAFADNTGVDGDSVAIGNQTTVALGDVCADGTGSATIPVFAVRNGNYPNPQTWLNGATITFSVTGTPSTGLSATFPDGNQVALPSDWSSQDNNTESAHKSAAIELSAGSATGPFSGTITLRGSGAGSSGGTVNRDVAVTVTADVVTCGSTNAAPEITSAAFAASSVGCQVSSRLNVAFTDADAGDTHTATVDWDDGSAEENLGTVESPFFADHTYTTPGSYTATVTVSDGTDSDSETANITVNQTYTVSFQSPLNGSAPATLIGNTFKNGRVIPVKATIYDDCALSAVTGTSGVTPTVKLTKSALSGATGTDAVEEFSDAGQSSGNTASMRWSDDGFWIYNLDSKALGMKTGESYRLNIFIGTTQVTTAQWVILSPTK